MNYSVYRREMSETTWKAISDPKGGEKATETLVARIIGKTNMTSGATFVHWPAPKEETKDPWGEARKGSIMIKTAALQTVQKQSLKEATVLRPAVIDGSTEIYPMRRSATKAEAMEQAELLGDTALGVVPFKEGYAKGMKKEPALRSRPLSNPSSQKCAESSSCSRRNQRELNTSSAMSARPLSHLNLPII